jgi:translocation and assembly module TamA
VEGEKPEVHQTGAQQAIARIEGVADEDLLTAIARAVGESKGPASTRFEARRRARAAAEAAEAALRTQGYYGFQVEQDVVDPDDDEGGEPPRAVIRITPGARFRFARPAIEWTGDEPVPGVGIAAAAGYRSRQRRKQATALTHEV